MKILVITQTIDKSDSLLGFVHGWIAEFAKQCSQVTAIGLGVGTHELPENVHVLSLGKEEGRSRILYALRFLVFVVSKRKDYDAVFVHMNPEYVLLGGGLWRLMGKKVGLWYAHGHASLMLRVANRMTDLVFTSTTGGFTIPSSKRRVVGQGIDCRRFSFVARKLCTIFSVLTVARISPVKDIETLIKAFAGLPSGSVLDIVGAPAVPKDEQYLEGLKTLAEQLGIGERVNFLGAVPNAALQPIYARADLFVNTSRTGSFDKTVGEAMATGLPVLTSNPAFKEVLQDHAADLIFAPGDANGLLNRMQAVLAKSISERQALGLELRAIIEEQHSLATLPDRILSHYSLQAKGQKIGTPVDLDPPPL